MSIPGAFEGTNAALAGPETTCGRIRCEELLKGLKGDARRPKRVRFELSQGRCSALCISAGTHLPRRAAALQARKKLPAARLVRPYGATMSLAWNNLVTQSDRCARFVTWRSTLRDRTPCGARMPACTCHGAIAYSPRFAGGEAVGRRTPQGCRSKFRRRRRPAG